MARRLMLEIDFSGRRERGARRWLLAGAVAGLAATVAMLAWYGGIVRENNRLTEEKSRAIGRVDAARAVAPVREEVREEYAKLVRAHRELTFNWGRRFAAVEKSVHPEVAILSIQPEFDAGLVRIAGEAKTYADILKLVDALGAEGTFGAVTLVSHQTKAQDPVNAQRFTLTAAF